ncbi:hypothetical protein VULLAG_LOCUS3881 [Vulpes lagopus]
MAQAPPVPAKEPQRGVPEQSAACLLPWDPELLWSPKGENSPVGTGAEYLNRRNQNSSTREFLRCPTAQCPRDWVEARQEGGPGKAVQAKGHPRHGRGEELGALVDSYLTLAGPWRDQLETLSPRLEVLGVGPRQASTLWFQGHRPSCWLQSLVDTGPIALCVTLTPVKGPLGPARKVRAHCGLSCQFLKFLLISGIEFHLDTTLCSFHHVPSLVPITW